MIPLKYGICFFTLGYKGLFCGQGEGAQEVMQAVDDELDLLFGLKVPVLVATREAAKELRLLLKWERLLTTPPASR